MDEIESLATVAKAAEKFAKGLGAYVEAGYTPGLELGRSGLSSGSIALHDQGVPLRLAGLGTRRLATLAIQKSAISEGAKSKLVVGRETVNVLVNDLTFKDTLAKSAKLQKLMFDALVTAGFTADQAMQLLEADISSGSAS